MSPDVPALIAGHAGRLRLAAVTRLLTPPPAPAHRPDIGSEARYGQPRVAALAGCHHASLHAGTPFIFGWARPHPAGPVTVVTTSPVTGSGLVYPPAARGHPLEPSNAAGLLRATPHWTRLILRHDSLITPEAHQPSPAPLDESLLDAWTEPFTWLLVAVPLHPDQLREHAAEAAEAERDARTRAGSPAYDVTADRAKARHRELRAAETTGAWLLHLLVGATSATAAATLAGLLATVTDLRRDGYALAPGQPVASLDDAAADTANATLVGTPLLAALAAPPAAEIPGVAIHARSTFATTAPLATGGLLLGQILDRSEHPAADLVLPYDSLARHSFVTGATGSGKTTTITHLLGQATQARLPWLVIEPTKAEYRHRLPAVVLRIGHPDTPSIGINPLQPADGFPLRTHADMAKALLVAAFNADEPFPQVLATAIEACYRDTGWDLALGQPLHPETQPRWPTLTDLTTAARRTIAAAGYGPEVQANVTGFVTVRLASLTTGTAATFLDARHPIAPAGQLTPPVDNDRPTTDSPVPAATPSQPSLDGPASNAPADGQDPPAEATPGRARAYEREDLQPTGRTDPTYGEEFMLGADGAHHFPGDPADTRRNIDGRLIDGKGYVEDANPRPTKDIQERAQHDLPTRRHHEPEAGASPADDRVSGAAADRASVVRERDATWDQLRPIADRLRERDVPISRGNLPAQNQTTLDRAAAHLSPAERLHLNVGLSRLGTLNQEIKVRGESLGVAGGGLVVTREFPTARPLTGGAERGSSDTLDRVVMVDDSTPALIVVEEKGMRGRLGSRLVPDTAETGGAHIRAEQGSTSYLRDLLQNDQQLGAALDRDPELCQRTQAIVNGDGEIRYLLTRTDKDGSVTATDFKIDFGKLDRASIQLPTSEGA